jgi:hypothetical protein
LSVTLREEEHILRVFENRMLRRKFRPKREEVAGGWRKLYNEALLNLHISSYIIRIIKSRSIRWAGLVARMECKRNAYNILVGKPHHSEDLRVDGRIILEWVLGI